MSLLSIIKMYRRKCFDLPKIWRLLSLEIQRCSGLLANTRFEYESCRQSEVCLLKCVEYAGAGITECWEMPLLSPMHVNIDMKCYPAWTVHYQELHISVHWYYRLYWNLESAVRFGDSILISIQCLQAGIDNDKRFIRELTGLEIPK